MISASLSLSLSLSRTRSRYKKATTTLAPLQHTASSPRTYTYTHINVSNDDEDYSRSSRARARAHAYSFRATRCCYRQDRKYSADTASPLYCASACISEERSACLLASLVLGVVFPSGGGRKREREERKMNYVFDVPTRAEEPSTDSRGFQRPLRDAARGFMCVA